MKVVTMMFLFLSFVFGNQINVDVSIKPIIKNGKLIIDGRTNLPNNTKLLIFVSNGSSDEVVVKNNSFITNQFSNQGNALESGNYQVSIQTKSYNEQPKNVQNSIGKNGVNLIGKYIEKGNLFNPGNIVKFTTSVSINTTQNNNKNVNNQCSIYKKIFYGDINIVKSLIDFKQTTKKDVCVSVKNVFEDEKNVNEHCSEKVITNIKEREALNTWYKYCNLI